MMLVDLKRPLRKGDLVPIRLKVELSDKTVKTIKSWPKYATSPRPEVTRTRLAVLIGFDRLLEAAGQ